MSAFVPKSFPKSPKSKLQMVESLISNMVLKW